jgi:hypothetical protein
MSQWWPIVEVTFTRDHKGDFVFYVLFKKNKCNV